jgi:hypothetical protein
MRTTSLPPLEDARVVVADSLDADRLPLLTFRIAVAVA